VDGNRTIPVTCVPVERFGGAFNYEEFSHRAWGQGLQSSSLPPAANSHFRVKSGDAVIIAYLAGSSRQGVILGGITHPSRKTALDAKKSTYKSVFNGLTTEIRDDGSYKVEFKGKPVNTAVLDIPTGQTIPEPIYDPLISGSFYGFDKAGSFVISDGSNYAKLLKSKTSPIFAMKVGSAQMEVSGAVGKDTFGVKASNINMSSNKANISAKLEVNVKALKTSIKGQQIAIGNDQVELFQAIFDILDTLSKVFLQTPTGVTTPIGSNPDWVSKIVPLMLKIKAATGKIKDPEDFSPSDPGDVKLESN
jgi:hypothetical protein